MDAIIFKGDVNMPKLMRRRFHSFWMMRRRDGLLLLAALLLLAVWAQRHRFATPPRPLSPLRVAKVVDGDTAILSDGRIVRYIGIDTPEQGQPYYETAKKFNRRLVQRKLVELEFDVERYDHYGRILAYVFVKDYKGKRIFVNAEMVRNGFARIYTKPPNVRYADMLFRLQEEARKNKRGLWSVYRPSRRPVIANRKTLTFHRLSCPSAKRIRSQNRLRFPNYEAALSKGYRPCRECQP